MNARERMARALCALHVKDPETWKQYLLDVDAMLDVLTKPDDALIAQGVKVYGLDCKPVNLRAAFICAIRAVKAGK